MVKQKESIPKIIFSSSCYAGHDQCDCDCACASIARHSSWETIQTYQGTIVQKAPVYTFPLTGEWHALVNPKGDIGILALNDVAQQMLDGFNAPAPLRQVYRDFPDIPRAAKEETVQRMLQTGLLQSRQAQPATVPDHTSVFSAWLHLTQACNLECAYCYVAKNTACMSWAVAQHAVDSLIDIATRHQYQTLKLKYAGGEPTLHFALVQSLHKYALMRTLDAGLDLQEVLLTNGVAMTDAMLDFIAEGNIELMVSLDGGETGHNRLRRQADGNGTYASVVSTVKRALTRGLRPHISITLTAMNLEGASEAVALALENKLPFNMNFYRDYPQKEESSRLTPELDALIQAVSDIFMVVRGYPEYPWPLTGILDRVRLDTAHRYTCSAGRDYIAVDTMGQVAACPMLLEEPCASLASHDILGQVREKGSHLFTPVDSLPTCQDCMWRTVCGGGCPLLRTTSAHTQYCNVYRTLLPELVKLEGMRLISQIGSEISIPLKSSL